MTSPSSGYLTVSGNVSTLGANGVCGTIVAPAQHVIMVSFKGTPHRLSVVSLYLSTCHKTSVFIWMTPDLKSEFAHIYNSTHISISVYKLHCFNSTCFKLFFSFFRENERPVKSSGSSYNCSVKHYASFHHHLACNLKTECEDGRDETGICPFSSPECKGLIALCNRCYKIVDSLHGFVSSKTENHQRADEYCSVLGGQLNIPKCIFDFRETLQLRTNIHSKRLKDLWTGLYSDDRSLPKMYTYALVHEDGTVLHHSFDIVNVFDHLNSKISFVFLETDRLEVSPYTYDISSSDSGTFCEFLENKTEENIYNSQVITLVSKEFLQPIRHQFSTCSNGHVTHAFLLCGSNQYQLCGQVKTGICTFSSQLIHYGGAGSSHRYPPTVPTFACDDHFAVTSYTLLCDFITDCQDNSDESFCKHLPCVNKFGCVNGECISFEKVCDYMFHCRDQTDEKNCDALRERLTKTRKGYPSPVLVNFDDRLFISVPMGDNDSCPDSHYRCPGAVNDCLPVYTRCNGLYDCVDHQDEEACETLTCPGFFRCRMSSLCLHGDHICDGWSHCPLNDDELACDLTCPVTCLCQGHTFLCPRPFSAALFPELRYLDATGSGMTLSDVSANTFLIAVVFAHCSLTFLPKTHLIHLRILDLSSNKLQNVNFTCFLALQNLQTLSLSNNPLTSLHTGPSSAGQHNSLTTLDLSYTTRTSFDATVLSLFPKLHQLNLTFTSIHTITPGGFHFTPQLTELYMDGSPVKKFPADIFRELYHLRFISAQNYKLCCMEILPDNSDTLSCTSPKDEISSCEDLLQSWSYRGFLWLMACLSLTGNVFCCCARLFAKSLTSASGFSVFVLNLTIADFLMGVYITIIGAADERFRGRYLYNDDMWKNSVTCKVAGFLSLLSSEVSALIIWFITLDRFIVLRFPFSTVRFNRTSAALACLLTWLTGWFLAMLPLLPTTSHWAFYSQTGICLPLPVTRREFKGRVYSFSVLIVLNFTVFLLISAGQVSIYQSVQGNALKTDSTKMSRDITIARRLITVAVTDFVCWFPIGLCGMLALGGTAIPAEVNVALAVFVLPFNSAINPFIYTFNTLAEKRRKRNETRLLKWLGSHQDRIPY